MCDMQDDKIVTYPAPSILHGVFENLCYETGKTLYEIKTDFSAAVQEHTAAYTALNNNMRQYMDHWQELGEDFFE